MRINRHTQSRDGLPYRADYETAASNYKTISLKNKKAVLPQGNCAMPQLFISD